MTNYANACEHLRQYPVSLVEGKSESARAELKQAAEAYKNHLATHTELKNYAQDAPMLVEALAGCFVKELTPLYRQSSSDVQTSESLVSMNSCITILESVICCLLQALTELCVDRCAEAADEDEVSAECQERRAIVRKHLPASLVSQLTETLIRRGVSATGESARFGAVESCAILARRLGTLDDESWLKTARLLCECVEAPQIRRAGVIAVGVMSKSKLALGKKTIALPVPHELTLCVSALMDILTIDECEGAATTTNHTLDKHTTSGTLSRYSISVILRLLQDPDRQSQVNWTTWLGQLLDDRFRPDADEEHLHGGLCFLNILYSSATEEFVAYASAAVLPLRVLPMVMKSEHRPVNIRTEASMFLMNCTDWPVLREMLMKADCIDLLSPLILEQARLDDFELHASILAVLAKLMLHGPEVRELLSDTIPFWELLIKLADEISSQRTQRDQRISFSLVIVLSALSFHQEFKAHMLGLPLDAIKVIEQEYQTYVESQAGNTQITVDGGDGGTSDHPLIQPGSYLDGLVTRILSTGEAEDRLKLFSVMTKLSATCGDGPACFHIVLTVFNLVRSNRDRRLLRKAKDGPDFDEQQLRELEMMYEKLPDDAKVKERLQYTSGGLIVSSAVRKMVLTDKTLLSLLINLGTKSDSGKRGATSKSLVSMTAQTIRYLASLLELRPSLVSQGGLMVLAKALELDPDDKHSRFALVSIVATVRPESHRYETRMSCTHQALCMIDTAAEELYVHIAARSLVNLTSSFDDVSLRVFDGGAGWRRLESVLTDWSDATSAYGAEIMCNIVAKDDVNLKIAQLIHENRMPWTVTLLFAYAADDTCKPRQLACLATLSYLTGIQPTAEWIAKGGCQLQMQNGQTHAAEKILELWGAAAEKSDNFDAQARLSVTLLNILFSALNPKSSDGVRLICQKIVLSIGLVWNQIDNRCRSLIESNVANTRLSVEDLALMKTLVSNAPSLQIRDIWAKLLRL